MKRLVTLATVLLVCGCGSKTLDRHALTKDAETLQSVAAESALVAAQVAEGEGTSIAVRVHTEYLLRDTKTLGTTLQSSRASPSEEKTRVAAARLAQELERDIERLHSAPGDRGLAAKLHGEFRDTADAAGKLAQ